MIGTPYWIERWTPKTGTWDRWTDFDKASLAIYYAEKDAKLRTGVRIVRGQAIVTEWIDGKRLREGELSSFSSLTDAARARGRRNAANRARIIKPKPVPAPKPPPKNVFCSKCEKKYRQRGSKFCRACSITEGERIISTFEFEAQRVARLKAQQPAVSTNRPSASRMEPRRIKVYEPGRGMVECEVAWDGT